MYLTSESERIEEDNVGSYAGFYKVLRSCQTYSFFSNGGNGGGSSSIINSSGGFVAVVMEVTKAISQ